MNLAISNQASTPLGVGLVVLGALMLAAALCLAFAYMNRLWPEGGEAASSKKAPKMVAIAIGSGLLTLLGPGAMVLGMWFWCGI